MRNNPGTGSLPGQSLTRLTPWACMKLPANDTRIRSPEPVEARRRRARQTAAAPWTAAYALGSGAMVYLACPGSNKRS